MAEQFSRKGLAERRYDSIGRTQNGDSQQWLRVFFDYAPDAIMILDVDAGQFSDANLAAEKLFGLPRKSLLDLGPFDLSPPMQPSGPSSELGKLKIAEAISSGEVAFEWWHCNTRGERFPCRVHLARMPLKDRTVVRGSIVDSTAQKLLELSEIGHRQILERIARGDSLSDLLHYLVNSIEKLLPGMFCSILLLDRAADCLRHGAAPSLPDFYNAAVDGITIGPTAASCGAAAFHGRRVIVNDISNHPNWTDFRELAERTQVKACWSEPIVSTAGEVLGTFALYYREAAQPSPIELKVIELAAQIAANAIERLQSQGQAEIDARLSAVAFETHDSILISDINGTILRVNNSFTKLTGYTADEVVGKTPRILHSGLHSDEFYREMWQAIRTEGYWSGEVWNKRKDGHAYLQHLTITAVRNESGEITHYVGDGYDLTEQKQAEAHRAEILAARAVQRSLLPTDVPRLPGVELWGNLHPADSVSGDFFDFLRTEEDSVGIVVADVSGHGLGPGLLMAQLLAHVRSIAEFFRDPAEMLSQANRLFTRTNTSHFVTMFLGRFDIKTHSFVYASAGHQGYLLKANGKTLTLQSTGIPLGISEHWTSIEDPPAVVLEQGDTLVVATDGFEEQINSSGEHFGRERLLSVVRDNFTQPARQIVETLCTAVDEFSGELKQGDDVTAVILKVLS